MDITRMAIITRTATMATMGDRHSIGTADTDTITATIVTTTITDIKVTYPRNPDPERAGSKAISSQPRF